MARTSAVMLMVSCGARAEVRLRGAGGAGGGVVGAFAPARRGARSGPAAGPAREHDNHYNT